MIDVSDPTMPAFFGETNIFPRSYFVHVLVQTTNAYVAASAIGLQIIDVSPCGTNACHADCDQSTGGGVLDLFDFLCFQNSFVNGEPYACDCDTSTGQGVCDIFDFLCFQDAFVGGCP